MRVDWCVSSWFRIKNTHSLTHLVLAPWSAGGGDREDMALSYVYADSGCVVARWLCVL